MMGNYLERYTTFKRVLAGHRACLTKHIVASHNSNDGSHKGINWERSADEMSNAAAALATVSGEPSAT
jgi:hypothetical protein